MGGDPFLAALLGGFLSIGLVASVFETAVEWTRRLASAPAESEFSP